MEAGDEMILPGERGVRFQIFPICLKVFGGIHSFDQGALDKLIEIGAIVIEP